MILPIRTCQIVVFLDHVAAGMIMPQLPPHARSLGCNNIIIGLMVSLYYGFQLISGPATKTLSGMLGKRTALILAISFCGIAYVLLGVTSSIVLFLTLRAFIGLFKQTQYLTKTLTPSYEENKKQHPELTETLNLLSSVGLVVGPLIGGHIMENFPVKGFSIIAFTVGALFCINSILVRRFLPKETEKELQETNKKNTSINGVLQKVTGSVSNSLKKSFTELSQADWSVHWEYFLFKILLSLCIGFFYCNSTLYLKIKHHASSAILGYFTSINALSDLLFSKFLGHVNNLYKDDDEFTMRVYHVFLTFALSFTGMALAPNIPVYVACVIPFFGSFVLGRTVISQQIVSKAEENKKVLYSNISNNISSLTGVITPLIVGVLGEYIGILQIVYVSIIIASVGAYRSFKKIPEILIRTSVDGSKKKKKSE